MSAQAQPATPLPDAAPAAPVFASGAATTAPRVETVAARNATALLVISVAQRVLSMVTLALLARFLPVNEFGAVGSALAIAALFASVADLGVETATIKSLSESLATGEDGGPLVGAALVLRSLLGGAAFVAGVALLLLAPFPNHVRLLGALALATVVNPFWSVYGAVLQSRLQVNRLRVASLTLSTVTAILTILAAVAKGGALGVLVVQLAASWALTPLIVLMGRSRQAASLSGVRRKMRSLLSSAWRLGVSGLLGTAYYRLDVVLLTVLASGSQVALYYASYRLTEALAVFPAVIVMAAFPALSRLATTERERAVRLATAVSQTVTALALLLAVSGILLADLVVTLLYGSGYRDSVPLIQILMVGTIFMYVNSALYQTAVAFGRANLLLRAAAIGLAVNVTANLVLIPELHAAGAAIATLLTELAITLVILPWSIATFRMRTPTFVLRAAGVGAVLACAIVLARLHSTVTALLLAAPLSATIVMAGGVMNRQLLRSLLHTLTARRRRCVP